MDRTAEILFAYVRDTIYDPKKASLDLTAIDTGFLDLARGLMLLNKFLIEERELAQKLANGILDVELPDRENVLASPLKALHSSLKHIAWQAKQIEKGDFTQHVDYMGEFADVFNHMAEELKHSRDELEQQAFRDPLTRLYNRRYGMETLKKMLKEGQPFVICFIDLDNLKYINDVLGHSEGDRFIISAARQLEKEFSAGVVARLGGDEFMALISAVSEKECEDRMKRVCAELACFGKRPDGKTRHPLSYGIIEVKKNNKLSASRLLSEADRKMYELKARHKAHFQESC